MMASHRDGSRVYSSRCYSKSQTENLSSSLVIIELGPPAFHVLTTIASVSVNRGQLLKVKMCSMVNSILHCGSHLFVMLVVNVGQGHALEPFDPCHY